MSSYYPYQPVPATTPSSYNPYSQYTAQAASYGGYFPYHPPPPPRVATPPPDLPPPPPDLTSITPEVASKAIERLIMSELRDAGFSAAQPQAMERLERDVVACARHTSRSFVKLSHLSKQSLSDCMSGRTSMPISPTDLQPLQRTWSLPVKSSRSLPSRCGP
jgi:transcription initiation factor TFIID subunit 8